MKKALLILFLLIGISSGKAQPYYFLQDNDTYTSLTGATSINSGAVWSGFQTFTIPIGFSFDFMDASFTSVDLEATGRLIFDASHFYFADMFVSQGLQDKGTSTSQSPLSYKLEGTAPNQILKIEVSNAEYSGDTGSSIDFQIWLYEYTSRIELHMGPRTINDPGAAFGAGPMSGVYQVSSWAPLTYTYGFMNYDDPASPTDTTFTGTGISTNGLTLTNAPSEDEIYIYTNDTSFLSIDKHEINVNIYPNPATDKIAIEGLLVKESILFDLSGKQVVKGIQTIEVLALKGGTYILQIEDLDGNVIRQKVIIGK